MIEPMNEGDLSNLVVDIQYNLKIAARMCRPNRERYINRAFEVFKAHGYTGEFDGAAEQAAMEIWELEQHGR